MMEFERGRVVVSRAGRDKGRLLAILKVEGETAFVADGRLRKTENPKKKKTRHLGLTESVLVGEALENNASLRKALDRNTESRESEKEA